MQSVGICRERARGQPGEHFFSPCPPFGGYLILLAVCAYASPGGQSEITTTRPNARSPPGFGTNLQQAIVQGTLLYAAGLTWNGRSGMEGEYQAFINRMGRATLGAFRSTPLGIVAEESGLTPARVLLDHRQTRFTQRHLARPQGHDDPEEVMSRWVSALAERL